MQNLSEQLPAKIKIVWRISALIVFVCGLIVWAILAWVIGHFDWPSWLNYPAGILVVGGFALELTLVPYRYRFWRYQLTATDVEIESGFIFHQQTAVPISRIQNVTLQAGPLFQLFGLQTVEVETAATSHEIAGVLPATAEQLKQQLMALAQQEDLDES